MTNQEAYNMDLDELRAAIDALLTAVPSSTKRSDAHRREEAERIAGSAGQQSHVCGMITSSKTANRHRPPRRSRWHERTPMKAKLNDAQARAYIAGESSEPVQEIERQTLPPPCVPLCGRLQSVPV